MVLEKVGATTSREGLVTEGSNLTKLLENSRPFFDEEGLELASGINPAAILLGERVDKVWLTYVKNVGLYEHLFEKPQAGVNNRTETPPPSRSVNIWAAQELKLILDCLDPQPLTTTFKNPPKPQLKKSRSFKLFEALLALEFRKLEQHYALTRTKNQPYVPPYEENL